MNFKKFLPYEMKFKKEIQVPKNIELGFISSNYVMDKEPFLKTISDLIIKRYNLERGLFLIMPLYEPETYAFKNWQFVYKNVPILKGPSLIEIMNDLKVYALSLPNEETYKQFKIMLGEQ